ncbi:transposase [Elizabethkingia anophelis]|uniref:IS21 family transposase n=1 Tax=Elizabethkingia anophelis TaxID=1117645 RepID=UPI001F4AA494|nr:IS21 family transposase [Elizabethkingia anophelis]MDV3567981.1 transposase [Elizabethkingia anophelis]MDV3969615.1 transposase [Elizabethkingia anophelis]
MANKRIDMLNIKQLLRLYTGGVSKVKISKQLGLSRNTVKKYIGLYHEHRFTIEELNELSGEEIEDLFGTAVLEPDGREIILESYFPEVSKELKKVGVTRYILWEEYKTKYPEGYCYSQFCHLYKLWSKKVNPSMHMEHKAGEKMFVDYTGKKLHIIDQETGEEKEVEVFVSILGASGMTFVEATMTQKKEDFLQSLAKALDYYGGVPAAIVTDNLKSAVKKSDKYEPVITDSLRGFASHYDTTILPTRACHPKDKALVENAVRIIYTRIFAPLRKQQFFDLKSLNRSIQELSEQHNAMEMKRKKYSRADVFYEVEKPALLPLPAIRYELKDSSRATVQKSSHVYLNQDKHYYSVPFAYIGKKVTLLYGKSVVEIYYDERRIAFHPRVHARYQYTTIKEHMPSSHQYMAEWNPTRFINWGRQIGTHCEEFITKILEKRRHPEQAYNSCRGVLSLSKKIGNQRLDNACKRALSYERYNMQMIKDILARGLDTLDDDSFFEVPELPKHKNIRGGKYYE